MVIVERMHTATEGCVLAFFTVVASCSNLSTHFRVQSYNKLGGVQNNLIVFFIPKCSVSSNCEVRLKIVQPTNEANVFSFHITFWCSF